MFKESKDLLTKFIKTTTISSLYEFTVYIYIAFLTPYLYSLGWISSEMGFFFAIFGITGIVVSPIIGTISDKIGRFKLILFGMVLETITLAGYLIFTDKVALILLRILASIAFHSVTITALSRIHDIIDNDDKNRTKISGIYHSLMAITVIVAPLIGGFVADTYGFKSVFLVAFLLLVTIIVGLAAFDLKFYHENIPHRKKDKFQKNDLNPFLDVKDVLKYKEMRAITLIGIAVNFSIPFSLLILPTIITQQLNLSNTHLSIAIFLMGVPLIFQYFFGYLADKKGKGKIILNGILLVAIGYIAMFFVKSYEILLLLIIVRSIGLSMFNVSCWSFISDIGEKYSIEGKTIGSYMSMSRFATSFGFLISGFLMVYWENYLFLLYAGLIIITTIITQKTIKSHKSRSSYEK